MKIRYIKIVASLNMPSTQTVELYTDIIKRNVSASYLDKII